ncbi:alpha/beta hydrolase [Endozoicomonas sp. G2_1]|uniref:alpha/beta fold hydrolase n=1 Tax=Endozoicomonas sp. G2_1 TaxID=2821091 RepID=UPI001ADAD746|nr:alpha/beta hydrolase [Endozoicomonas sp. G2_1]
MALTELSQWHYQTSYGYRIHGYQRPSVAEQSSPSDDGGELMSHAQKPRIHFLHGNGFSALTLAAMAAQLPEDWPLWLTNVPGHGLSEQPNHRWPDWHEMAFAVAQTIAEQTQVAEQGPVIGVGHSLGGILTLLAAADHPEYFEHVILLDPPMYKHSFILGHRILRKTRILQNSKFIKAVQRRRSHWPDSEAMAKDLSKKALYKDWHPQVMQDFINSATNKSEQNNGLSLACSPHWEAGIFSSYPSKLWQKIKKVQVPVDILTADNSYSFIRPAVTKAARLNSHIRQHKFGQSHCFPMEQPVEAGKFLHKLLLAADHSKG